uniref:Uncharacterized protein n=1 Tax=Schistosoma japonicum TaxID=6182 RepID=Q5C1G6_SCHJA|nr:unknown [Schistosoma japonicum]
MIHLLGQDIDHNMIQGPNHDHILSYIHLVDFRVVDMMHFLTSLVIYSMYSLSLI